MAGSIKMIADSNLLTTELSRFEQYQSLCYPNCPPPKCITACKCNCCSIVHYIQVTEYSVHRYRNMLCVRYRQGDWASTLQSLDSSASDRDPAEPSPYQTLGMLGELVLPCNVACGTVQPESYIFFRDRFDDPSNSET